MDAEVETVQADFYRKPYAEVHERVAEDHEDRYAQPVNYWDNDDGFWDDYLAHRHSRDRKSVV